MTVEQRKDGNNVEMRKVTFNWFVSRAEMNTKTSCLTNIFANKQNDKVNKRKESFLEFWSRTVSLDKVVHKEHFTRQNIHNLYNTFFQIFNLSKLLDNLIPYMIYNICSLEVDVISPRELVCTFFNDCSYSWI